MPDDLKKAGNCPIPPAPKLGGGDAEKEHALRTYNIDNLSKMRTYIKTFLSSTSKSDAEKIYSNTVKIIDKAINKNLIHKNNGARKKSLITRHLNSLS